MKYENTHTHTYTAYIVQYDKMAVCAHHTKQNKESIVSNHLVRKRHR